jgi:precorrin-6Y C5,15-methyltransferase (decarboxylating)
MTHWLDIIGVGEAGVTALSPALQALVANARTILGTPRLLASLAVPSPPSSQGEGASDVGAGSRASLPLEGRVAELGAQRPRLIPWDSGLDAMLAQLEVMRGTPTVVLASGDPNGFGIGATLAARLEPGEFAVHPAPSSFQFAAARLHWPLQHVATVSLHGRPAELLHPHVLPGNRILALTSDAAGMPHILRLLRDRGYGASMVTVLENLGGPDERIVSGTADAFAHEIGDFHVLAIECAAGDGAPLLPPVPGLPDEAFVNDGQLTKREVRAITLARLEPTPGALLWDVGAGCGSVAIEWMRAARDARAIAFERDGERLQTIAVNAAALGVPGLRIEGGDVPQSLAGMPSPDAVFIGGGLGEPAVAELCWAALRPGGRFVVNVVTVEGELALFALFHKHGGEVCRIDVSPLDRIGGYHAFRPRRTVTQLWTTKP